VVCPCKALGVGTGMQQRRIGSLEVSAIGLGTNNFGTDFFGKPCTADEVDRIVGAALDAGVTLFDTAEEYSVATRLGVGNSEVHLGQALGARRDDVLIASKFLNTNDAKPEQRGAPRIVAACEDSLRRLGTDRIDLYQQHVPDRHTPLEEILTALDQLQQAGKIREIGCCNLPAEQLDASVEIGASRDISPYRSCQTQFSVLERPKPEVLASVGRAGMAFLAYFPLASGLLTGKYRKDQAPPADARLGTDGVVSKALREGLLATHAPFSEERMNTVESLIAFAEVRGRTVLELAISWLVCQPNMGSVITGATKPEQIIANASAGGWVMSAEELTGIDAIVAAEGPGAERRF
jgi:aryl-alcohol dehydrogenase-like predicted oxidoreductase